VSNLSWRSVLPTREFEHGNSPTSCTSLCSDMKAAYPIRVTVAGVEVKGGSLTSMILCCLHVRIGQKLF
jgi:hypothetical protein